MWDEDVIVDRLFAATFWKSQTDWEQAIILYAAHADRLRRAALDEKATREGVADIRAELVRAVEAAGG